MGERTSEPRRDLGFEYLEAGPPVRGAYRGLAIYLRDTPTRRHFDPEMLDVHVRTGQAEGGRVGPRFLRVYHPWTGNDGFRTVLGRLLLRDRVGKSIEAFNFGGRLTVERQDALTYCQLTSDAPILDLEETSTLSGLFASEVEVLVAELRGQAVDRIAEDQAKLASADPFHR